MNVSTFRTALTVGISRAVDTGGVIWSPAQLVKCLVKGVFKSSNAVECKQRIVAFAEAVAE